MSDGEALVFARCVGFLFRAPGFSNPAVPAPLRAGLAYVFSLALAQGYATRARLPPGGLLAGVITEVLIGAAIGVAASLLYDGAYAGGRIVDDYVGIRVSMPSAGTVAPSGFGRLWSQAFTTGFFVLGGYRMTLAAFAHGFETLPPGALVSAGDLQTFACTLPTTLLRAALLVAAPAIGIAFAVQCALAAVSRVVSRLSTFSLSFAVVFACVLLATLATIPVVVQISATPWFDLSMLRAH
ncbi:MAG TPA: flagellar biosynthetic protein FliR [Candidatus Acidoferrales bacterium]|nr:flagellar biosynthetic protein FliR [Candidatus Acidoferrales bacterium]